MAVSLVLPVRLSLAALALGLAAGACHAQWKWRDKTGQINASDRAPPMEVPEKDILSRPAPDSVRRPAAAASAAASGSLPAAATPGTPAKGPLEREMEARKRVAEQEQSARAKVDEEKLTAQRAENCRRARGHVAALESGQRMARVNDKGEREVLDDRGRAEELRQSREVITSDCK
jgi:hypothetical protein